MTGAGHLDKQQERKEPRVVAFTFLVLIGLFQLLGGVHNSVASIARLALEVGLVVFSARWIAEQHKRHPERRPTLSAVLLTFMVAHDHSILGSGGVARTNPQSGSI